MDGTMAPIPGADNPGDAAAEAWLTNNIARASVTGPFADFFTISLPMARALLRRNSTNRAIVATGVKQWSAALRKGDWQVNGEPIIVSDTGELNDGQHRLTAVVLTGIPMPTLIVFGVARDSRKTVDGGHKRTAGHVLGMLGVTHMNLRLGTTLGVHRSTQEIERELAEYPDLAVVRQASYKFAREFRQSSGTMQALHHMMWRRDPERADRFFQMLADGIGLTERTNPISRLRQRLTENLAGKAKLPQQEVAAITIKAWNSYRLGKSVTQLRWTTGGDAPEAFPQVK
jgi:hypothetical protein